MEVALREAKQLCEAGILSHAEFNVAKGKILLDRGSSRSRSSVAIRMRFAAQLLAWAMTQLRRRPVVRWRTVAACGWGLLAVAVSSWNLLMAAVVRWKWSVTTMSSRGKHARTSCLRAPALRRKVSTRAAVEWVVLRDVWRVVLCLVRPARVT